MKLKKITEIVELRAALKWAIETIEVLDTGEYIIHDEKFKQLKDSLIGIKPKKDKK